jgi:hypothetical protein
MLSNNLSLASPVAEATWEARGTSSTIDITFQTPGLQNRTIECQVRTDLDFGSDHFPIATHITLDTIQLPFQPRRCWKQMDHGIIEAGAAHLIQPRQNLSPREIDQYEDYLVQFTQELIEQAVPWSKPSSYSQPWWNQEVQQAVRDERDARRQHDWDRQQEAKARKHRTIHWNDSPYDPRENQSTQESLLPSG